MTQPGNGATQLKNKFNETAWLEYTFNNCELIFNKRLNDFEFDFWVYDLKFKNNKSER